MHCAGIEVWRATEALKLSSLEAVRTRAAKPGLRGHARCKLRSVDLQALARVGDQHLGCHVRACLEGSGNLLISGSHASARVGRRRWAEERGVGSRLVRPSSRLAASGSWVGVGCVADVGCGCGLKRAGVSLRSTGESPSRQQFVDLRSNWDQLPQVPWVFKRGDEVVVLFPCLKLSGLMDNLADKARKSSGCLAGTWAAPNDPRLQPVIRTVCASATSWLRALESCALLRSQDNRVRSQASLTKLAN